MPELRVHSMNSTARSRHAAFSDCSVCSAGMGSPVSRMTVLKLLNIFWFNAVRNGRVWWSASFATDCAKVATDSLMGVGAEMYGVSCWWYMLGYIKGSLFAVSLMGM